MHQFLPLPIKSSLITTICYITSLKFIKVDIFYANRSYLIFCPCILTASLIDYDIVLLCLYFLESIKGIIFSVTDNNYERKMIYVAY